MNDSRRHSLKSQIVGLLVLVPIVSIIIYVLCFAPEREKHVDIVVDGDENIAPQDDKYPYESVVDSVPREFRVFDPNSDDYRTLIEAGLPKNIAVSIIRWRESGKTYRIKEDLALLYNMTDSLYFAIEEYIYIADEYGYKPSAASTSTTSDRKYPERERHALTLELRSFSLDTVTTEYLRGVGFSYREAELILRYRDMIGGYRCYEEFEECYGVDSIMAERLRAYVIFPDNVAPRPEAVTYPIELNSADSTTLRKVVGIGEKSVMPILRYRELLGGYYSPTQISELEVVTTENFRKILPQIWCDSAKIKKININFASPNELMTHPYLSSRMLKRLIKQRELKGGWSTIEEMIEDKIFTEDEAARIAPYLCFGTQAY